MLLPSWPRRLVYPIVGALLAAGAPGGLVLARAAVLGQAVTATYTASELARDPLTYTYVGASTAIVFIVLGWLLGAKDDVLRERALTDALTELPNRRYIDRRLGEEVARSGRYGTPLSLLIVDIDHLKEINDRHGHHTGDAAIRAVAQAVRQSCRSTDLVGRWAGDEFVLIAPATTADEALEVAGRIRDRVRLAPLRRNGAPLTVSVGIADLERTGATIPESLWAAADLALYAAKRRGRDRSVAAADPTVQVGGDVSVASADT